MLIARLHKIRPRHLDVLRHKLIAAFNSDAAYHYGHKRNAMSLLKNIESEKGKLNPRHKKLALEYAHDVLGWKGYAPWLEVYSAFAGEFKEGWIPDNYYGSVVIPKTKGLYGRISKAKSLSKKLLNTNRLPDVVYHVNGLFFTPDWTVLSPENVEKHVFENDSQIVYKADDSNQGRGVRILTKETFDLGEICRAGNGVFQSYIKQNAFFDEFMPNSVATLRITSVVENSGKISCRAAYLRIARTTDSHVKSASAIKIPVDLTSGKLYADGYSPDMRSLKSHPDTGVTFEGKFIPNFDDCIIFALKTHQAMPCCRSIGWDVVVDKNGTVRLMEWNGHGNDIKFSEATRGPCFADLGWEKLWKSS